ncbi:MAG: tetratricopeptide repeat protein [Nitrospiraceae bacterium]|nr:MAG: tetratricopeptide repeat protein [Nitrospiraceae bacterium]
MSLEDIENLKNRFEKDPNSKLFVPLAEEYRKEGMLDEAVAVLSKGLENQPDYMSARVSLGKIYVEKGMLEEARAEFEHVVSSVPDNLFAHKKLAEIYRDTGERDRAIKAFRKVLKLNPMDEDAVSQMNDLEKIDSSETPTEEAPVQEKPKGDQMSQIQEDVGIEESTVPHEVSAVDAVSPESSAVPKESLSLPEDDSEQITTVDDELTEMQSYVYGDDETVEPSEDSAEGADDIVMTQAAEALQDEDELSFEGIDETVEAAEPAVEELPAAEVDAEVLLPGDSAEGTDDIVMTQATEALQDADELSFEGIDETVEVAEPEVEELPAAEVDAEVLLPEDSAERADDIVMTQAVEELSDETELSLEDIDADADVINTGKQEIPVFAPDAHQDTSFREDSEPGVYESVDEDGFFDETDRYIAQGNYVEAISLYNRMLASNPDDSQVLQRAEDLKSLLKLLGKDKEILISKLDFFLERIHQRRNEFYRSS